MKREDYAPKKASPVIGLIYSVLIMVTTLYKYFLIGNIPWYAVQFGYIGVIGLSVLWVFMTGELSRGKISIKITAVFLLPYLLMLLESLLIWLINQKPMVLIRRGIIPISYQMLQIIAVGAACIMLGQNAAYYTALGLILGNAAILAGVLVNRGIATGISEMIAFYAGLGGTDNLTSRALEVHDLTFAMGELLIYYISFDTKHPKRIPILLLSGFFFLLGWKRSAIPGVVTSCMIAFVCQKLPRHKAFHLALVTGLAMVMVGYLYIFVIRQGIVEWFTKTYDINMMGRNELYAWIEKYYVFSPSFMGQGIGFITEIMQEAIENHTNVLNHELSIHSDILARYIELGFVGNLIWSLLTYMYILYYIVRHHNFRAGIVYFSCLFFCYITYFTDNTVSYYHINLVLRVLPISFVFSQQQEVRDMLRQKDAFLATNRKKTIKIS